MTLNVVGLPLVPKKQLQDETVNYQDVFTVIGFSADQVRSWASFQTAVAALTKPRAKSWLKALKVTRNC